MKQLLSFVLITVTLVMTLFGCDNGGIAEYEGYNYITDCQLTKTMTTVADNAFAKSEFGYYVLLGKKIYYIENGTMEATPLCGKPNCLHDSEQCNSFVGAVDDIFYSNGDLYYISDVLNDPSFEAPYLTKMSSDGSKKDNIYKIDYSLQEWIIHRGYFYFCVNKYKIDEDSGLSNLDYVDCYIYRYPLDGSVKDAEEVYFAEEVEKYAQIISLIGFGNNLYFYLSGTKRNDKSIQINKTVKLNLKDFSVSEMVSSSGYSLSNPTLLGDELVFSSGEMNGNKYIYYKTDFDGCNPERFFETYAGESIICDGKYLYVDNYYTLSVPRLFSEDDPVNRTERCITVYDSKLNKIDEINMGSGSVTTWIFLPIDDEYFIFSGKNDTTEFIFYYDKKDFGTINGGEWERKYAYKKSLLTGGNSNAPGALSDTAPHGSDELVSLWQKAKDKEYGVKDSFQPEGAEVEGGFSVRLMWEQDGGTFTAYFPFMELESEAKAKEYVNTNPYALQKGSIVVNIGVESVPQEVYDMLFSILDGVPIEPIDSKDFSGENFVLE